LIKFYLNNNKKNAPLYLEVGVAEVVAVVAPPNIIEPTAPIIPPPPPVFSVEQ
jgi:hypothetical protein